MMPNTCKPGIVAIYEETIIKAVYEAELYGLPDQASEFRKLAYELRSKNRREGDWIFGDLVDLSHEDALSLITAAWNTFKGEHTEYSIQNKWRSKMIAEHFDWQRMAFQMDGPEFYKNPEK